MRSRSHVESPGASPEERDYYSLSRRVYAVFAPFYDLVVRPLVALRRRVARVAAVGHGMRILDVASGTGAQALAFAAAGADVIGIDHSPEMLRVARRKTGGSNPTFLEADAASLPFAASEFDASSISFALHEMPGSVRARVLAEMSRVTRPGGAVIVVDYGLPENRLARALVYRFVRLYERDHYAEFVRGDLAGELAAAGLTVRSVHSALLGAARFLLCSKSREEP